MVYTLKGHCSIADKSSVYGAKGSRCQGTPVKKGADLGRYCGTLVHTRSTLKPKIFNSGIPISFSGLRRDGKWASLEWRELDGTGMLGIGNFALFPGKKIWYPKMRPGMQTSTLELTKLSLIFFS